jgi:ribosome-associated protein
MLVVNNKIKVPSAELQFSYARSQGPGGQNVNKVNSKATLRWLVTANTTLPAGVRARFLERYKNRITDSGEILLTSQKFRERGKNVTDCLARLRELIQSVAEPPKKRKATKPTKGSKRRRRKNKEAASRKKQMRRPPDMD